jgi:hypothetical protein
MSQAKQERNKALVERTYELGAARPDVVAPSGTWPWRPAAMHVPAQPGRLRFRGLPLRQRGPGTRPSPAPVKAGRGILGKVAVIVERDLAAGK